MVTQFGYVTIWSIVWPLAPIFALINNYVELRADALKLCHHVRRPVGDRVETIGSWLNTLVRSLLIGKEWANSVEHHLVDRSCRQCGAHLPIPTNPLPSSTGSNSQPQRTPLPRFGPFDKHHLHLFRLTNHPHHPPYPRSTRSSSPSSKPRIHHPPLDRRSGSREIRMEGK